MYSEFKVVKNKPIEKDKDFEEWFEKYKNTQAKCIEKTLSESQIKEYAKDYNLSYDDAKKDFAEYICYTIADPIYYDEMNKFYLDKLKSNSLLTLTFNSLSTTGAYYLENSELYVLLVPPELGSYKWKIKANFKDSFTSWDKCDFNKTLSKKDIEFILDKLYKYSCNNFAE